MSGGRGISLFKCLLALVGFLVAGRRADVNGATNAVCET